MLKNAILLAVFLWLPLSWYGVVDVIHLSAHSNPPASF